MLCVLPGVANPNGFSGWLAVVTPVTVALVVIPRHVVSFFNLSLSKKRRLQYRPQVVDLMNITFMHPVRANPTWLFFPSGLSSRRFLGLQDIHEVECSGQSLHTELDLLTMVFYEVTSDETLGFVNHGKRECTAAHVFVSCDVDDRDARRTRLKALISDLAEGESRAYGCNITAVGTRGRSKLLSWTISIHQISE